MAGGKIDILVEPDAKAFPGKLRSALGPAAGIASTVGKGIGLAIAGGTALAATGLKKVIETGVQYERNLNELEAVSGATAVQMAQVGAVAKKLGADMTLPATSAADAAAAMVELAKGGLTLQQSMDAAKGTLQLAAAAQVDAAQAAEIQSSALNQFGLAADQAGRVADVLANTANASAGSILDMANSLKYVGPVARSLKVPIEETAAAIGLLANNGIQSEQAGTSLRSMMASLASPSKAASGAMKTLGITAFDAQGRFVGLRAITEQLAKAKGKLKDSVFQEAAATAFGNEALSTANALANSGAKAFDEMAQSVGKAGGAAEVAAAKTKGLGGAWEGLLSQAETVGIGIFEAIDGPLEKVVRSAAQGLEKAGPAIVKGFENVVSAGSQFGPLLAKSLKARGDVIVNAVSDVLRPVGDAVVDVLGDGINAGIGAFDNLTRVLDRAVKAAKPVAQGIADVAQSMRDGGGPISVVTAGIDKLGSLAVDAAGFLLPLGSALGLVLGVFADLPGPVQTAVLALTAYKLLLPTIQSTGAVSTLRQFTQEMAAQRGMARLSGQEVGRLGAAVAAFQTTTIPAVAAVRSFGEQMSAIRAHAVAVDQPISAASAAMRTMVERSSALSAMAASFQNAAAGAGRFGAVAGTAAAAGTGLRLAAGGLVGALGGPFGLAITGAAVGLSLLASQHERAAQFAQQQARSVDALTAALQESRGAITESVRAAAAREAQNATLADSETKVMDAFSRVGISLGEVTEAMLNQDGAADALKKRLADLVQANTEVRTESGTALEVLNDQGQAAQNAAKGLDDLVKRYSDAANKQKALDDAIKSGKAGALEATSTGKILASAMKTLADRTASAEDKARALDDALRALSGDQLPLDDAISRVRDQVDRLEEAFTTSGDAAEVAAFRAKGFGSALLDANGNLNTTLPNARLMRDSLRDMTGELVNVAQRTFEMARAQGADVPSAIARAKEAIAGHVGELEAFRQKTGLTQDQFAKLLNTLGLSPEKIGIALEMPGMSDAQRELLLLQQNVKAVPGEKRILTTTPLSDAAIAKLQEVGIRVERIKDSKQIVIYADKAGFDAAVAQATRPATKTIRIIYNDPGYGGTTRIEGQRGGGLEFGGVIKAYARGGIHKLRPMSGGIAQVVAPNTWRVVGDRIRDDEAYIPINNSRRSENILEHAAGRMGFALIRTFANGGVASSSTSSVPVPMSGEWSGALYLDSGQFLGMVRGVVSQQESMTAQSISHGRR